MNHTADLERYKSILANHLAQEIPSTSWRVAKPGSGTYACSITWAPGILALSDDIGTMVVEHYSFDTWENAACWVNSANYDYFMEKTNVERDCFNHTDTVETMIECAYTALRAGEPANSNPHWLALFALFGGWVFGFGDPDDPSIRKEICRVARRQAASYTSENYYEALIEAGDDEPYIAMEYPQQTLLKYAAFQFWATGIVEAIEARNKPGRKSPFDHIKSMVG